MPVRSLSFGSFFDPEFVCPASLQPGTVPWLLARFRSTVFPSWLFKGWRGEGRLGRDAWPAAVLATLMVLRWSEEGMSRRASIRRASTDVVWRGAMGLELGTATPDEKTMRVFERFLQERHPDTDTPRYLLLHENIVRACLDKNVARQAKWAMDSTPMWCYGAVADTVRLLGDGLRLLARAWARAHRTSLEAVAEAWDLPFLLEKSTKGAYRIEWRDRDARADVVADLTESVLKAVRHVRRGVMSIRSSLRKGLLRRCRNLLRVIESDLGTDESGRLIIARGVAESRIVSMTDPEARHGRKSKSQTFNGFKLHVLGDVISGLILSLAVTHGNMHDAAPAHRLIRRAKALRSDIEQVMGDTAYGGARLRHVVRRNENVKILAPPPPVTHPAGKVGKLNIILDFDQGTATCANGVKTDEAQLIWSGDHQVHVPQFQWSEETCGDCPKRKACLGRAAGGKRVTLHPYERELRAAREEWKDPSSRESYRTRTQCERLISVMTRHGGRQARAWGLRSAQVQAHAVAMASNLRLLAAAVAASQLAEQAAQAA